MSLDYKDMWGSRGRCLMLTSMLPRTRVAHFLDRLVCPYASVGPDDDWMPRGFVEPDEAKLGETPGFLCDEQREEVTDWWLEVIPNANTPNWDLASTCTIHGKRGLVLIEAKAHEGELCQCGKAEPETENGRKNDAQIRQAMKEANAGLQESSQLPGWSLSADSHYQLSNRFAWAWKIASLGKPVVLVYLGFLNCAEMHGQGRTILITEEQWHDRMLSYAEGIVPPQPWDQEIKTNGATLSPLIRSAEVNISAQLRP